MAERVLYIDALGGLSGDMFLGAFLDLGLPPAELRTNLEKVGLERFFSLRLSSVQKHGIAACKVDFPALPPAQSQPAPKTLGAVEALLAGCALPEPVASFSLAVFRQLAAAEAAVHGSTPERVHFHEVGDYDTLADIVGVATALVWCRPDLVSLKPVPLGTGFVDCAHGRLPVPVPAVRKLLVGLPVVESGIVAELVTPTGAALLKTIVASFPAAPGAGVHPAPVWGYGAGQRDLAQRPNLLSLGLARSVEDGEGEGLEAYRREDCLTLETALDDLTPEKLAALAEALRSDGALEVLSWPAVMKKGRLGVVLQVLLHEADEAVIVARLFSEGSTLGLRRRPGRRYLLERELETFSTSLGPVRCKIARDLNGNILNLKPEHDDLAALAEKLRRPLTRVEQQVLAELPQLEKKA
ncbi:MAG: nickel pincer cofactor biosynthesis protein LarC [Deltaproteobacteria bacterium]|nr:nickel pincer cofactor biosynthesis protein LarC [Deltaproteobacteria bacterium]